MTLKVIYFMVNGRLEHAEFRTDCSSTDVKDLLRASVEAGPHDILTMYDAEGNVVNISPSLTANDVNTCYRLEVVASDLQNRALAVPTELRNMDNRLENLETKVLEDTGKTTDLKSQVESFKRKLENVEHRSWIGLFKGQERPQRRASQGHRPVQDEQAQVRRTFRHMSSLHVNDKVREYLKTPLFDNWQWEEAEMLVLLQVMYTDLDFVTAFHIEVDVLQNFLFEVYRHYNNIPFHNFQHCFCVTQMMYGLIWLTDLRSKLERIDLFVMLTSALCHDLDHPGYNNVYQINARTDLALRYNDISPLENHHCAVAFAILAKPECNILKSLTCNQYKHIRAGMIKCILATDMARHNEILNKFKVTLPVFDFRTEGHKEVLMKIMVKVSDISNEARPMAVAEPWLDCLLQEFFNQSDSEKLKGLPVTPFMDRDKVSKPSSQTGFIRFVLLPLFTELTKLFPCLEQHILEPVRKALDYYSDLEKEALAEAGCAKP
ncbi:high affinity cGMP-specific 3',5'-cyclic phosphodiesterase 9A [Gadus chalcogrammus]|uniref:high affinity cGMP-specific 3',5'-cyclic phosphodiesterase 9A n=1 Tax=Gadus chalcogrammus TaxID=1042646 RepID=UPI0024C40DDD|nr:high affinity cGMP-specific 3',5'-cyclic phosphodiesterase 9A [Gadus chalcogrammus]